MKERAWGLCGSPRQSLMAALWDMRGVSLVELMVATLIFSVVAAFGMQFLVLQHGWAVYQEDVAEAQQQARAALDFMVRELSILGFGLPEGEAAILKATGQEVEFFSNLDHEITHLSADAETGDTTLSISDEFEQGQDFEKGKTVWICRPGYCEKHTLAKNGGRYTLELNEGLEEDFPVGSVIQVVNQVRYALKPMDTLQFKLARKVDGGVENPVAEGLASMTLEYLDWEGRPVAELTDIDRIQIRLTTLMPRSPDKVRSLVSEVYLRNGDGSP